MKIYIVSVPITTRLLYEVKAEDEQDAIKQVESGDVAPLQIDCEDLDTDFDVKTWTVQEQVCPNCGASVEDGDVESTYCGSMCPNCFTAHAEECKICRKDFQKRGLI